ncbi:MULTISPECIES: TetR/AcrR family transcriptional regulator [Lactobacillus]|uniref:TetR/AcrR family transcriptional regulator n=1 Tax=Lactobacillus xujianguonis TaxID=2495899 RepID=A0A437STB1_9LACO|nr:MULTISPECIES: TetR/AcrR family transcriptional regulator [Lactobacillus]RVU70135.1 TetR/AcrR family transcriptional regulator [Lactobacillus xujianguonis]RVU73353.1 TetR/AcrR family transcriptional regulator [Lactobacillus xujianguonis]
MAQKRSLDLNKVIDKASDLISDQGLKETTMPALARALGVRSQSLYHYVSGRHQLLSLVGAKRIRVLHNQLVDKLMGLSGTEALLKFADLTRNFILHDAALSSILYHLNEYGKDDAINQEITNLFTLGEKLKLKKDDAISFHALVGAVLGYVFLDKSTAFANESKEQSNENYHQMILRLVQPMAILQ